MEEKKELWMVQTKRADFSGLAMRLGVSPVAVRVMRNRGLTEEAEMKKYLYGTLDDLYDPRLMKGMEQAAELIVRKLKEGKHVRIIGDYDIDGVCSTYILLKGFRQKNYRSGAHWRQADTASRKKMMLRSITRSRTASRTDMGSTSRLSARRPQTEWIRS